MNQTQLSEKYQQGYKSAKDVINRGGTPQELLMQSYQALDQNDYDKGWQQACIEYGAQYPE